MDPLPRSQSNTARSTSRRWVLGSTLLITAFTAGNLVTSFLLQIVLASFFGARAEMDAFLAATTLPTLVNNTLLGAFNFVLVPLLVELGQSADERQTWRTTSHLVNAAALLLGPFTIAGMVGAFPLLSLTNPGFNDTQLALTLRLFHLVWPSLVFIGLSNLLASAHYARRQFLMPSLGPVANLAVALTTTLMLAQTLGIYAAAWGTLLGAIVQFLLLAAILLPAGRYSLRIETSNPINRRILILMAPLLLGSVFYRATGLVERFFASSLGEGNISYLGYAFKLATALEVMIAQGVSITFLPLMSHLFARQDLEEYRRTLSLGLRGLLVVALPVSGLVYVLARPTLQLLLERGAFDAHATEATALTLIAYQGWVCAGALGSVLTNAFYSRQDTMTVVQVGILGMVVYLVLAYFFAQAAGTVGLALALSASAILNALAFLVVLHRRLRSVEGRELAITCIKCLGATFGLVSMGLFLWPLSNLMLLAPLPHSAALFLRIAAVALAGTSVYILVAWLVDLRELKDLFAALGRLLRRSRQSLAVQAMDSR